MPAAMTLISSQTVGTTTTTLSFNSIPGSYRDLYFVINGSPADTTYPAIYLRFNGDTAANYSAVWMGGNGSTPSSSTYAGNEIRIANSYGAGPATSSKFVLIMSVLDYAQTDKHKTVLSRDNVADAGVDAAAGRWASTSAVTSASVYVNTGTGFAVGTTAMLYGIAG